VSKVKFPIPVVAFIDTGPSFRLVAFFSEKFKACILDFRPIQRGGRTQAEIRNLNIEILNKPKQVMNYGRTERRLFRAGSGLAWESERIAGPELGHATHNIVRFR